MFNTVKVNCFLSIKKQTIEFRHCLQIKIIMINFIIYQLERSRMLNINKFFPLTRSLAWNMIRRQYFSIIFMDKRRYYRARYDALIQDFDKDDLHGQISKLLGKPYLSPLQENQKQLLNIRIGLFYGKSRGMMAVPTRSKKEAIWVHYLINTGCPYTYLSKQALNALQLDETQNTFSVLINGDRHIVMISDRNFAQINILGMDFLQRRKSLFYDIDQGTITLTERQIHN